MFLDFEKWQGCSNDFIVIPIAEDKMIVDSITKKAPVLCGRDSNGIGADGILLLSKDHHLGLDRLRIINSDGSKASHCGNGLRCAAGFLLNDAISKSTKSDEPPEGLEIASEETTISCQIYLGSGFQPKKPFIIVDMGNIALNPVDLHQPVVQTIEDIQATQQQWSIDEVYTANIRNNHVVLFTESSTSEVANYFGPRLQQKPLADGINVMVATQANPYDVKIPSHLVKGNIEECYEVHPWERGVGPTMACGSGACAVSAAALSSGLVSRDSWIVIKMPGGNLFIKQEDASGTVLLAGVAQYCFKGQIEI